MSHTTRVSNVKITDIAAAKAAVETLNRDHNLGLTFTQPAQVRLWSEERAVAFAIGVPGTRFNVGFEGNEQDGYSPIFDAHGGELSRVIGGGQHLAKTVEERNLSNIGKFMHAYGVEAVRNVAQTAGAMMQETFNPQTGETVMQLA